MYKDLTVEEFKKAIENDEKGVILDVRTPAELADGAVEGHQLINIMDDDFEGKINALDKNKNYYVYCRSGKRSVTACQYMASQGFNNLNNMLGGIIAWNEYHK